MSRIMKDFASPSWWLSVVVVAFLVNLLSAYTKPRLDGTLAALSASWRRKVGEAGARRTANIERIRASGHLQILLLLEEIRSTLGMIIGYAFTVGLVVLAAN